MDPKPGEKPKPESKPGRHVLRKPTGREREKKYDMGIGPASMLGKVISAATEFAELLDAFFDSFDPALIRQFLRERGRAGIKGKLTVAEKLSFIFQNLENIRPGSALAAYMSEQFEDKAFGKLGKIGQKSLRNAWDHGYRHQTPGGNERGPWDSQQGVPMKDPYVDWLNSKLEGLLG